MRAIRFASLANQYQGVMGQEGREAHPKSVSFLVYEFGQWQQITLKQYQQVEFSEGGPHEEGFSHTETEYFYDAGVGRVTRESHTNGRDCDGPMQTWTDDWCSVEELEARVVKMDVPEEFPGGQYEIKVPEWQTGRRTQRDVFAESMGY